MYSTEIHMSYNNFFIVGFKYLYLVYIRNSFNIINVVKNLKETKLCYLFMH